MTTMRTLVKWTCKSILAGDMTQARLYLYSLANDSISIGYHPFELRAIAGACRKASERFGVTIELDPWNRARPY